MKISFRFLVMSVLLMAGTTLVQAQKKALTAQSYDEWQSLGQKIISADGKYIAWVVNVQEGDGWLEIASTDRRWKKQIPRGTLPSFSNDNQFLVCRIKPLFKDSRDAKIKKKAAADMPKDSLAICWLGQDSLRKVAQVKSYKLPEEGNSAWVAWLMEKPSPVPAAVLDSAARLQRLLAEADSLVRAADSIRNKVLLAKTAGLNAAKPAAKPAAKKEEGGKKDEKEGTELVLLNMATGAEKRFPLVTDYVFNKKAQVLAVETTSRLLWQDLQKTVADTVMKNFNEVKGMAIADDASRLVFYAERDSSAKALHKYYKLWQYTPGQDSAVVLLSAAPAMLPGQKTVLVEETSPWFSENNQRVFFGAAAEWPVKDTSLIDFETAKLDLWSTSDDYLQPQQLVTLNTDKTRSWLGYVELVGGRSQMLGDDSCEFVRVAAKGDGAVALGTSTKGYRIQQQWTQDGMHKLYLIDVKSGTRKLVAAAVKGRSEQLSPNGKYISWYDAAVKGWKLYDIATAKTMLLSKGITVPLYDEEDDHPDDPPAHGFMGWLEGDEAAFIYDRYDIWRVDPQGIKAPVCISKGQGRRNQVTIRYNRLDPETDYIKKGDWLLLDLFDQKQKGANWMSYQEGTAFALDTALLRGAAYAFPVKAKNASDFIYLKQTPASSDLYAGRVEAAADRDGNRAYSALNPQQTGYNWFTVELKHWKTLAGETNEGLLYKPENFDPAKKYPVILYFYERDADTRYRYIEPMPVRASINIAYYTSNGYIVFDPDIKYKTGQPGEDAYNAVVGAAKWLQKMPWVDSAKMGIQGHSWGGYQVAYLVTRTNMFAAAESGAPVSNMTSAYGGIRWGTGISRQFQYEKSQSRLGKTLWEDPQRYLKNSPLFRVDKIKTPLLILHNDKDDAVPWYQGIELFTAMKRLNKQAWLVSYNDELHGIMERRNRKDWTIRMAQFFDHYLKGAPAPKWMTDGIPARDKGVDWAL